MDGGIRKNFIKSFKSGCQSYQKLKQRNGQFNDKCLRLKKKFVNTANDGYFERGYDKFNINDTKSNCLSPKNYGRHRFI